MSVFAPTSAARTLSREDILRLGQAGRPWDFLPVAARAIDQAPGDQALRFLMSASLARLGLKTLAGEQLDALPAEAQSHPDIEAMRRALAGLPEDRVPAGQLRATCVANVKVLVERGHDPGAAMSAWLAGLESARVYRALDGNVVWCAGEALSVCSSFSDLVGAAGRFVESAGPLSKPGCIVLDGMASPWMFRQLYDATPAQALGFHSPIHVVEPDAGRLLNALALADLRGALADPRVRVFVGPEAAGGLEEYLLSRIDYQISSLVVPGGWGWGSSGCRAGAGAAGGGV